MMAVSWESGVITGWWFWGRPMIGDLAKLEENILEGEVLTFDDSIFQAAIGQHGPLEDEGLGDVVGLLPVVGDDCDAIRHGERIWWEEPVVESVKVVSKPPVD